jgi:replicative DNA helicase
MNSIDRMRDGLTNYTDRAREAIVSLERSLAGACLRGGPQAVRAALDAGWTADDVASPSVRSVCEAMLSLTDRGAPEWDDAIVASECLSMGTLDAIGGVTFIARLRDDGLGGSSVAPTYASQVRDEAAARRMATALDGIVRSVQRRTSPTAVAIQEAIAVLHDVGRTVVDDIAVVDRVRVIGDVVTRAMDGTPDGSIPFGMPNLDELMRGGARAGQLILVAARPGMGKSAFALQVASNVADIGVHVAFFSMEMSDSEIIERELAQRAGVPIDQFGKREFADAIFSAQEHMEARPLSIVDRSGIPLGTLLSMIRRMVQRDGVGLVVVDYIGLIRASSRYQGDRNNEVSEISASLKALASELRIPIIALSQLNRAVEARPDKRPNLSDLRDSGALEQDANIVIMLYREEYYLRERCDEDRRGICDVMVQKNRGGKCGIVPMKFNPPTMRFRDDGAFHD